MKRATMENIIGHIPSTTWEQYHFYESLSDTKGFQKTNKKECCQKERVKWLKS